MKERNELARAMGELPDDLLLEAEQTARTGKVIKFRRFVAAAAVIALLAVTVGAVSAGITWKSEIRSRQEMIQKFGAINEGYYKDPNGTLDFEKLEFTLPLEQIELPEQNMEIIRNLARQAGRGKDQENLNFYVCNYMGKYTIPKIPSESFGTLADVEEMLGIALDVPEPLRNAIVLETAKDDCMVWMRVYTRGVEPAKVEIRYQLPGYATNGDATGTFTLALTEEAAQEGMLVESYSYEKEGPFWQEELTIGGYEVNLYGNDPEAGFNSAAGAVYISEGIGYHISSYRYADIPYYSPNWPYYDSAREMLLSLFVDGE